MIDHMKNIKPNFTNLGKNSNNWKYIPYVYSQNDDLDISNIDKDNLQYINLYIIYDTHIVNDLQTELDKNHSINKNIIMMIIFSFKNIIQKYNIRGTLKIIPQTYSLFGPLEIFILDKNTQHTSIKEQFEYYMSNCVNYCEQYKRDVFVSFVKNLEYIAKNLVIDMNNTEGFSHNISIIFSDNFEKYNKYAFSIINQMTNMKNISEDYVYGYIIKSKNHVNFVISTNNESYCSNSVDISNFDIVLDNKNFIDGFNIFFNKMVSMIHKKIKKYL